MKKIIFFVLVITQVHFLVAQSISVTGGTSFTGNLVEQVTNHLDIENVSSNAITIECLKTDISLPAGAEAFYCFAGNCYGASQTTPSDQATLQPGQKFSFYNNDADAHSGYYNALGSAGVAQVQYCFYDVNNPSDETCITITYDCSPAPASWDCDGQGNCADPGTGNGQYSTQAACDSACMLLNVNEETLNFSEMSDFYPNPVKEAVYFSLYQEKAELLILDILGNQIKRIYFHDKGVKTIDVTDMSKGIYFGNLVVNNKITSIKKLIVK